MRRTQAPLIALALLCAATSAAQDAEPPAVAALALAPGTVDVGPADAVVTARVRVTDAVSGTNRVTLSLWGPSRSQSGTNAVLALVEGTPSDGVWEGALTIPRYSQVGSWTVRSVFLRDAAGNDALVSADSLAAQGLADTVAVVSSTGEEDLVAPTLTNLEVSPDTINVDEEAADVLLVVYATDDLSGVRRASVSFWGPSRTQIVGGQIAPVAPPQPGEVAGSFAGTVRFPQGVEPGRWTVRALFLTDAVGNTRFEGGTELAQRGLPSGVTVRSLATASEPAPESAEVACGRPNPVRRGADVLLPADSRVYDLGGRFVVQAGRGGVTSTGAFAAGTYVARSQRGACTFTVIGR